MSYGYDGYGGGGGQFSSMKVGGPMGTMQTASVPTQAVGLGSPFQAQAPYGTQGVASLATQHVGDMSQWRTTPSAMKTQPGAFGAYDQPQPMGTRPQAYGDTYGGGYGGGFGGQGGSPGYGGQGYGGYGGAGYGQNPMSTMPQNYGMNQGAMPPTTQLSQQQLMGRDAQMRPGTQGSFAYPQYGGYGGPAAGTYGGQPGYGGGMGGYPPHGAGAYGGPGYQPGYGHGGVPMGRKARRSACC
eukprot:gb/GFBE01010923.1/.p1 GENE.gb/GFBE01010923.1/~~gb/GFBE01010923.1/.p1  ORF type:complete len:241 (+),score=26.94 gb/GFBE01010923.1/:1-723(+)